MRRKSETKMRMTRIRGTKTKKQQKVRICDYNMLGATLNMAK